MTKTSKVSQEELEFLAAESAKRISYGDAPQMKQLAINADKVDSEGNKIDVDTWHIRNDNTYTDTVIFRPLRYKQKFIRMVQNGKQWKTDNQSVFVENFEPAYDTGGGVGCGRIIGKLPSHWTEEQKLANYKKATIYGFLFGLVTFPGKEPVLVNFRAAPAKANVVRVALSTATIGAELKDKFFKLDYTMKLVPIKGEKFVTLEMTPDLNNIHNDFADIYPYIKEVDAYIEAHNAGIMRRRTQILDNLKASTTYKEVTSLADDFSDEIPFGAQ